jgi:hypothetical protein
MKRLLLYGRPDCHLCDSLLDELRPLLAGRAELRLVDIDQDDDLIREYALRIPVLIGDGRELSGYPLDLNRVRAYLDC